MSLVTRCPSCGTVFRVVRDQLKVSEGWVRCGRCTEVFNAGLRLFELESDGGAATPAAAAPTPPTTPPSPTTAPARSAPSLAVVRLHPGPAEPGPAVEPVAEPVAAPIAEPAAEPVTAPVVAPAAEPLPEAAAPAATAATVAPMPQPAQAHQPPALADGPELAAVPLAAVTAADLLSSASSPSPPSDLPEAAAPDEPVPTPGFVLRAERAARRRHPARRGLLALLSLLLAALLGAQIALHYRDGLAAGWPASRPWLQAACDMLGCRIEPPRRIDSLSVDSSALVRIEGSPLYRLSLVVQNRSATAVRMPAIELALTDTRGQTTARRVLTGTDLGQPSDSLPPRSDVALQAMLDLGERGVAGYTVELFYP